MQTKSRSKSGFTLVEIMIVVAIIGLLAAIGIPNFIRARQTSQTNSCINNLRVIDGAKQQWALENKKTSADVPAADGSDIQSYLGRRGGGELPTCPIDTANTFLTSYNINTVGAAPTCKIDLADHTLPQ